MARRTARRSRRSHRRQHGGGFGFTGPAFAAAPGFAPEAARTAYDDCVMGLERPVPQVGGACGSAGCIVMAPAPAPGGTQRGGGGGTGGYMPILNNDLGKFHAGYLTGECPQARQVGGGEAVAAVSYPAGYGFDGTSPYSTPSQSAHFLEPRGYGQQCMGGGARRRHSRRHRSRRQRRSQRRHRRR